MATSAQEVFATVELLEMILLGIDMQTLLVSCQRVNKTFKATIDGSRELQKALWFLPDPEIITRVQDAVALRESQGIESSDLDPRNPLIVKFAQNIGITLFCYEDMSSSAAELVHFHVEDSAADQAKSRPSWEKMLIFQGFEAIFDVCRADWRYRLPEAARIRTADRMKMTRADMEQWELRMKSWYRVDTSDLSSTPTMGEIAKCLEKTLDLILENAW